MQSRCRRLPQEGQSQRQPVPNRHLGIARSRWMRLSSRRSRSSCCAFAFCSRACFWSSSLSCFWAAFSSCSRLASAWRRSRSSCFLAALSAFSCCRAVILSRRAFNSAVLPASRSHFSIKTCRRGLLALARLDLAPWEDPHQSSGDEKGGETRGAIGGVILLICLDVTDLATIGTLASCSSGNLIPIDAR